MKKNTVNSNKEINKIKMYEMCIRQKCLMCKSNSLEKGKFCSQYTCPLWLLYTGCEITTEAWQERTIIHEKICEKLLAEGTSRKSIFD